MLMKIRSELLYWQEEDSCMCWVRLFLFPKRQLIFPDRGLNFIVLGDG